MLKINERILKNWADQVQTDNLVLAEHDYRISYLLSDIFSNNFLKKRLLLKGGTAINKLHLKELSRLSVDLDFNQIGNKRKVLSEAKKVREIITKIIQDHDPTYKITYDFRYQQTTIHAKYNALSGNSFQPIKVEVSHVERFPILKTMTKTIELYDLNERKTISTYQIEELLATKIRALYGRAKLRDLYDVNASLNANVINNRDALRKMVLYYLYRNRTVFNSNIFFNKIKNDKYSEDISIFLKPDIVFVTENARKNVIKGLSMLRNLDKSDTEFLILAKSLLHKDVKKADLNRINATQYPLKLLFEGIENVSKKILKITKEDISMTIDNIT